MCVDGGRFDRNILSHPTAEHIRTPNQNLPTNQQTAFADEPLDAEDEAAQAHAALLLLGPPTSRAERLGDFLAGWLQHHIFASRAPLAARARAVTTALRALLDLTGASRYYLPAPSGPVDEEGDGAAAAAAFGPACFAVGALPWGLTSPWRARAEGSNDSHARLPGSGATRLWLGAAGGRDLWREGMAAPAAALGASPDTMRPPIAGLRLPVPATGDGRDDEGEAGEDVMDVDGRGRGRARGAGRQSRGGLPAGRDRICTAGGCPLRRRQGRGGGSQAAAAAAVAASSSSASGSGAAQVRRRRVCVLFCYTSTLTHNILTMHAPQIQHSSAPPAACSRTWMGGLRPSSPRWPAAATARPPPPPTTRPCGKRLDDNEEPC